jgi:hypothetical protein
VDVLQQKLARAGAPEEFGHVALFKRDLERLFCLAGVGPGDHVFLPTAHGRELAAIQRLLDPAGPADPPTFHLEFRHALDMSGCFDDPDWVHPYTTCHRSYFDDVRRRPQHPRVRLYTDTEELTEEYQEFSGLVYDTLPIPFRSGFLAGRARRPGGPLCLSFFGDVREEKGFFWLPELVDALLEDYLVRGKARFLIQGTLGAPQWSPKSQQALARLQGLPPEYVTVVGADGPLAPDDYYRLVSETDVLLCPYNPHAYRRRSSGTVAEAIAAGIPTVVPGGTWLARHQPPGAGETFTDLGSFVEGVRRICDDYDRYAAQARAYREQWLAVHSPLNLVDTLLRGPGGAGPLSLCRVA